MKDSVETRLGLFFIFAVATSLVVLDVLGGFNFNHGKRLVAFFKDVQELKVGAPVKMAGVPVGHVTALSLTNGMVRVVLQVSHDAEVRVDSKASVKFMGLMGQNYVAVDFGSSDAALAENDAILRVQEQPDFGALMTRLDSVASGVENLTKSFSGERIDSLFGPLTDFIKNNSANLGVTIANIRTTTDRIVSGQGTVGRLINEDTLYRTALTTVSNFQGTAAEVQDIAGDAKTLLTNANQVVVDVRGGKGTVGKLMTEDKLYVEATGSMTNLHQILLKINHGQGAVGQLINDDSIIRNAKLSLQKLDKATESLEDTGPLSVVGTLATSLF